MTQAAKRRQARRKGGHTSKPVEWVDYSKALREWEAEMDRRYGPIHPSLLGVTRTLDPTRLAGFEVRPMSPVDRIKVLQDLLAERLITHEQLYALLDIPIGS
jgi:hypothetical protein